MPTKGSEGKQEERTKHQLQEDRMHGGQQKEQPNMQITKQRYQNQASRTISISGKCFNKGQKV